MNYIIKRQILCGSIGAGVLSNFREPGISISMKLKKFIETTIREYLIESSDNYKTWKRKNVTLRGIKELGKTNDVYGSFGKGLYTVPLSNKAMAKQYGDVYFVINSIPKNPKIVDSLNNAEIVRQNIINDFCKKHGKDYDPSFFESKTTMDVEMLNAGYDGLVIKGREIINYKPSNVKYFKTEDELQKYYSTINERTNRFININESYDDIGLNYILTKRPKLKEYNDYINKKIVNGFTYLNFKPDAYFMGNILVFDNADNSEVSNASYGKDYDGGVLKATIDVRSDKRRKGIATEIYKWVEELTGETVYPEPVHTDYAEKLLESLKLKMQ